MGHENTKGEDNMDMRTQRDKITWDMRTPRDKIT